MDDTEELAREVSKLLVPRSSLALIGQLGAGKTTLVRSIVKCLESLDEVSSPSYVLANEYRTRSGVVIEHWDLYRLSVAPAELYEQPSKLTIRIIEWADRDMNILNSCEFRIELKLAETGYRTASLQGETT